MLGDEQHQTSSSDGAGNEAVPPVIQREADSTPADAVAATVLHPRPTTVSKRTFEQMDSEPEPPVRQLRSASYN